MTDSNLQFFCGPVRTFFQKSREGPANLHNPSRCQINAFPVNSRSGNAANITAVL